MKFYESLLWLYPRWFRERFGADMRRAFAEDLAAAELRHQRSRLRLAPFLAATAAHAVWFGTLEHLPKGPIMKSFFQFDIRAAYRSLRATPIVTAIALASLALGIGANTALFSILNGLVLKPLPVHEPDRIELIDSGSWTYAIWEGIQPHARESFDGAFAWAATSFNLAETGRREVVAAAYASGDIFNVLGVPAIAGRMFSPADDVRGAGPDGPVAVISEGFWRTRFGGDPSAIGQRLMLDGKPFTVIGVFGAEFFGMDVGRVANVIVPMGNETVIAGPDTKLDARSMWWLDIYLRRKPLQSREQATLALRALQPGIRDAAMPQDWDAKLKASFLSDPFDLISGATGQSSVRDRYQQPLSIALAVVVAVLIIACANIANLLLSRATARRQELSLRLALGASRFRIGRQLFAESLLLAAAGAAIGLAVAKAGAALLVSQLATSSSRVTIDLSLDWRVLGFTAGMALATTLLFGLAPAFGIAGIAPNDALKEQSRSVAGDRKYGLRNVLVVAQMALSLALIVGAGLFVRTFSTLMSAPLGFNPDSLLIVNATMSTTIVGDDARRMTAHLFREAAAAVPGVERAAISALTPMSGMGWNDRVTVRGGIPLTGRQMETWVNSLSEGWFDTYGVKLVAGRDFSRADSAHAQRVAIVNQAFVKKFIGDGAPAIGRLIESDPLPGQPAGPVTIVGVVSDSIYRSVRQGIVATMYIPFDQGGGLGTQIPITIRLAAHSGENVERTVATALSAVDGHVTFSTRAYTDMLRGTLAPERITAILSAFFGGLALLLAGLGLYGVTAYSVNRRRSEIAVRMALGATVAGVMRSVLGRVGLLVGAGVAAGVGLSVWLAKFVEQMLFGLPARDVTTMTVAAVALAAIGLLAGWLPARRATRLDPTVVLRE